MHQVQTDYKTFRVSIDTDTLLDDFSPILIEDIVQRFKPIYDLKEEYCSKMIKHCEELKNFSEFSEVVARLNEAVGQIKLDFKDCEENVNYFTIVFMGAVSSGKTSMICDLLNVNPTYLNDVLKMHPDFDLNEDAVVIAGEVATANVYEFLVESSRLRLVDVPGTGGVVHDNITLAPFVNKADCVAFLSNASTDLSNDDYNFVVQHVVGLRDPNDLNQENKSNKKALIVVNKWNTITKELPPQVRKQDWRIKEEWILWGDSEQGGTKFKGLSELFRRTLQIVPANTSYRRLDETTNTYDRYGEPQLDEMLTALKNILREEGILLKLERPKLILKNSLSQTHQLLQDERTTRSVDELVEKLRKLGVKISLDSSSIMALLSSRLDGLENRIKQNLYYQIKTAIEQWTPSVALKNRIMGLWPKGWIGSDRFGAEASQRELQEQWKREIEEILRDDVDVTVVRNIIRDEAEAVSQVLEGTFKAQLAELQLQTLEEKIKLKGVKSSLKESRVTSAKASIALEQALNNAVANIKQNIVDDIVGIIAFDAIVAALIGMILSPLGSVLFFAIRRWMSGQSEKQKAKQELEEAISNIAAEVAADQKEEVASHLRKFIESSVENIADMIDEERESLSKPVQALDAAINNVHSIRERLNASMV